jgi:sugar O-acyltransferase (sialic acid O-acetyltransferase NeuD family)
MLLCYLADSADWQPPEGSIETVDMSLDRNAPAGLRISQPALALARQHNLDLTGLVSQEFITEATIRRMIDASLSGEQAGGPSISIDPSAILVYGGGGHGKALIDLLRSLATYRIVGVLDDGIPIGQEIMGVPVLGGGDALSSLYRQGVRLAVNAVGGIGDFTVRMKIFQRLREAGFRCPTVIHPRAWVEASAELAEGVQVMPLAYVGSEATAGYGVIVNTGAIVSHDCRLGDYANLSPGAILAGEVQIGRAALVGMGATINLRVQVGDGARIGNGATVKSDVPANGIVRAGTIFPG